MAQLPALFSLHAVNQTSYNTGLQNSGLWNSMQKNVLVYKIIEFSAAGKQLGLTALSVYHLLNVNSCFQPTKETKESRKMFGIHTIKTTKEDNNWILSPHSVSTITWPKGGVVFVGNSSITLPHQRAVSYKHGAPVSLSADKETDKWAVGADFGHSHIPTGWSKGRGSGAAIIIYRCGPAVMTEGAEGVSSAPKHPTPPLMMFGFC